MMRRQGTTLIEVLVAIFVMGIGLIALLTLFPLGAIRMAQAIQDDKCAAAVVNATAIATIKDIRNDPSVANPPNVATGTSDIFSIATPTRAAADPNGPSYPVFVDPIGYNSVLTNQQKWLADGTGGNYTLDAIARTPTSFTAPLIPGRTNVFKWFALLDDHVFDAEDDLTNKPPRHAGAPSNFNLVTSPVAIRRDTRYSWAYLVQRPKSSDPSIATCVVVVYNRRPLAIPAAVGLPAPSAGALPEAAYSANFNINTNTITVSWGTPTMASFPPNVNVGDWLLDTTYVTTKPNPPGHGPVITYGTAHGYFYRVVGITTPGSTGIYSADYEVQQPIRGFPPPASPGGTNSLPGVIVLEGVADVYERGVDRKFD